MKVLDYKDQMGTEFTLPYSSTLVFLDLAKLNLLALCKSSNLINRLQHLSEPKDFSISLRQLLVGLWRMRKQKREERAHVLYEVHNSEAVESDECRRMSLVSHRGTTVGPPWDHRTRPTAGSSHRFTQFFIDFLTGNQLLDLIFDVFADRSFLGTLDRAVSSWKDWLIDLKLDIFSMNQPNPKVHNASSAALTAVQP